MLSVALSTATWGCARIAAHLSRTWQVRIAPSTVPRLLRRVGLATPRRARLTVLEQQAARTAGLLTERTQQQLWRARHGRTRHVHANEPGGTGLPGHLLRRQPQRRGQIWHITACDVASPYGTAMVMASHTTAAAGVLRDSLAPLYGDAGWPLRRVLTDGGPEFKGAFDEDCRNSGFATPARNPAMPGPTGSWSACRALSCKSTGAWRSVGATSPAVAACSTPLASSCATTTATGRTRGTGSAAAPSAVAQGARAAAASAPAAFRVRVWQIP